MGLSLFIPLFFRIKRRSIKRTFFCNFIWPSTLLLSCSTYCYMAYYSIIFVCDTIVAIRIFTPKNIYSIFICFYRHYNITLCRHKYSKASFPQSVGEHFSSNKSYTSKRKLIFTKLPNLLLIFSNLLVK